MNKKGDVPMIAVFLVALGVSIMALAIFYNYAREVEKKSMEINRFMEIIDENYKATLKESRLIAKQTINDKPLELKERYRAISELRKNVQEPEWKGNFFAKIREGNFVFEKKRDNYILEIHGITVVAEEGSNLIRRNFDLVQEFDSEGNFIRFIKE